MTDAYKVRISPEHVALIRSKALGMDRGLRVLLDELLALRDEKAGRKKAEDLAAEARKAENYRLGALKAKATKQARDARYKT